MALINKDSKVKKVGQVLFRDDYKFKFRRQEIIDTFMVERENGVIKRGWKHFLNTQFTCPGYKGIPSGDYTLSFERDIILDPYKLINKTELPDQYKQQDLNQKGSRKNIITWLVEVGVARRSKIIANKGTNSQADKVILFLGSALIIELVLILIKIAIVRGG